jgi:hypothetical protein
MKRRPTNSVGSIVGTALKAFALVSLARSVGPRRIGRLAALATGGYLTHLGRRHGDRKHPSTK